MNTNNLDAIASTLFHVEKVKTASLFANSLMTTNSKDEYSIVGYTDKGKMLLNTCSERYKVVKNEEILLPLMELLEKQLGTIQVKRVVSENNARFSVQIAPVKKGLSIGEIVPMFKFSNSYDGTVMANLTGGLFRLVCSNGASVPVKDKFKSYTFKHNDERIFNIGEVNEMVFAYLNEFASVTEKIKVLKSVSVSDINEVIAEMVKGTLFPKKALEQAKSRSLQESITESEDMNLWLAYNGLNYVLNHDRSYEIAEHIRTAMDERILSNTLQLAGI